MIIRYLATIFLFLVLVCALFIASYDIIAGKIIDPTVLTILGAGIGSCLTITGLNHGVNVINGTVEKTVKGVFNAQEARKEIKQGSNQEGVNG